LRNQGSQFIPQWTFTHHEALAVHPGLAQPTECLEKQVEAFIAV
jgi:hypothetical protein